MRAGKLDTLITIERGEWVSDEYGQTEWTFTPIATMRAQVIQQNTEEFMRGWGNAVESVTIFRTRWMDNLLITDTVRFNGILMGIIEVKPLGRRRGLEIRCKVSGRDG